MKVLVVGLGLIGGSYALGLKKAGHYVYGQDINNDSMDYALKNNIIDKKVEKIEDIINDVEVLIVGLYPELVLNFIKENNKYFHKDLVITDICGVKECIVEEATKLALPASFCGHHPMAGREKSGVIYANTEMFKKANYIITPIKDTTKQSIEVVTQIGKDLEFGNIFSIEPKVHDQMIAHTSQLTHAIAVAIVNCEQEVDTKSFIGDSYRDLTRIAMINENLWSELFLSNKEALINEIDVFTEQLALIKQSIQEEKTSELKDLFIKSTKKRSAM